MKCRFHTRTLCMTSSFSILVVVKLVSLLDSVLTSLLLSSPARLAKVELVGLPTDASEPRLPPNEPVFAGPRDPLPAEPPI